MSVPKIKQTRHSNVDLCKVRQGYNNNNMPNPNPDVSSYGLCMLSLLHPCIDLLHLGCMIFGTLINTSFNILIKRFCTCVWIVCCIREHRSSKVSHHLVLQEQLVTIINIHTNGLSLSKILPACTVVCKHSMNTWLELFSLSLVPNP